MRETVLKFLGPVVQFTRLHDKGPEESIIGASVAAWHQMKHDVRKVAEARSPLQWKALEKRLLKREAGFVQRVNHRAADEPDAEAVTVTSRPLAPFLTLDMHLAFLLSPRNVVMARQHAETPPPPHTLTHPRAYR